MVAIDRSCGTALLEVSMKGSGTDVTPFSFTIRELETMSMNISWLRITVGLLTIVAVSAFSTEEATAQRIRHHHHDAAGHMIDHAGHHVDAYGRHTGAVGVYHNQYGQSIYQQPAPQVYVNPVGPVYGNTGGYFNASVPQNVVPYSLQANSVAALPRGGSIKIFNPSDSGGEVKYTLNGTPFTIKPGSSQLLPYDRTWTVEFGSGGAAGNVRYSLQPGAYKFKVTDAGWNLFQSQDQSAVAEIPPAPIPRPDVADGPRPGLVP